MGVKIKAAEIHPRALDGHLQAKEWLLHTKLRMWIGDKLTAFCLICFLKAKGIDRNPNSKKQKSKAGRGSCAETWLFIFFSLFPFGMGSPASASERNAGERERGRLEGGRFQRLFRRSTPGRAAGGRRGRGGGQRGSPTWGPCDTP
jgi:hypothetical protein